MAAVLEHAFNNHNYCDADWCKFKSCSDEYAAEHKHRFRDKVRDIELYKRMQRVMDKHTSPAMLNQLKHNFASQKNESLNYCLTKIAPKDMNFATSKSLEYRVALVIGVDSIGYLPYINDVAIKLGFDLNSASVKFLKNRDKRRESMSTYHRKSETKLRRRERTNMKILKQIAEDKKAMAQSLYYQSGIAVGYDMVIPTEDQNDNTENNHDRPTAAKRQRTTTPNN